MPYPSVEPRGVPYYGAYPAAPRIMREEELDYLNTLAQYMRDDLKEIEVRIQEIESKKE